MSMNQLFAKFCIKDFYFSCTFCIYFVRTKVGATGADTANRKLHGMASNLTSYSCFDAFQINVIKCAHLMWEKTEPPNSVISP